MDFAGLELFLDDVLVSTSRNVRRVVQKPKMHPANPLVGREHPWEASHVAMYGSVHFDEERQRFRMWYNAFGESYYDQQMLAYAESADGISWDKPKLDERRYPGHRGRTNILFGPECNIHGPGVIPNPDPDSPDRWLLLFDSYDRFRPDAEALGIRGRWSYTATSPDGIRWSPTMGRPAFAGKADSAQCVLWDPTARRFRAYSRLTTTDGFGQRIRTFRLLESKDFERWGPPREIFRPDPHDGAPDTQLQQLAVSLYDGIYIGFVTLFRISQYVVEPGGRAIDEGSQIDHTQMVTSRDGLRFDRVADRQSILEPAASGFGSTGYRLAPHVLVHGDEVRLYLSSNRARSGRWKGLEIGMATLQRDRFVAVQPDRMRDTALWELTPMIYRGTLPQLNANIGKAGWVRAEVADMNGVALPGFSQDEAIPLSGDSMRHEFRWTSAGDDYGWERLSARRRREPVRLRLWFEQASLHALRTKPA